MRTRPWVWGGAVAASVLAVSPGTAAGTHSAVLTGSVLAAPAEPVCMPRVPCMRPAAGVVLVFQRAAVVRARVTTEKDGTYRVALAPGRYDVRVTHPAGVRRLSPAAVRALGGEVKRVNFYIETGIR